MELQAAKEGIEIRLGEVCHTGVAVTLDDELKLVGKEWLMLVNIHCLQIFTGEEGLEAALDYAHGAIWLFIEGLKFFHSLYCVGDVVAKGNVEAIDRIQFYLDNLVSDAHVSYVEPIMVYVVNRNIDYIHSLAGVLVLDGDDILDYRDFASLGEKARRANERSN